MANAEPKPALDPRVQAALVLVEAALADALKEVLPPAPAESFVLLNPVVQPPLDLVVLPSASA